MRGVESGLVFSAAACAICCMSIFRICVPFFHIRILIGALLGIALVTKHGLRKNLIYIIYIEY